MKLFILRARLHVRKYFFSHRVVPYWNSLPQHVVNAPSANSFKSRLDKYWHDMDSKADELPGPSTIKNSKFKSAISRKWLDLETPFQRTTNRKWHTGFQMVTWPMTSRDSQVLWGSTVGYPSDSLASCYPRDAMLARVIVIATCLSVRPSVCHAPVLCQNEER